MLLSGTSGISGISGIPWHSVVATQSNSFTWVSVSADRCFDFTCFRVENTDSQTCMYVNPNIDSILSAAHLTLRYFPIGTLFHNATIPSLKADFSLSSSQISIISNSVPASFETRRAFKQSVLELNGSTRNVITGLFSCRSQNRDTKLSFGFQEVLHIWLFAYSGFSLIFAFRLWLFAYYSDSDLFRWLFAYSDSDLPAGFKQSGKMR